MVEYFCREYWAGKDGHLIDYLHLPPVIYSASHIHSLGATNRKIFGQFLGFFITAPRYQRETTFGLCPTLINLAEIEGCKTHRLTTRHLQPLCQLKASKTLYYQRRVGFEPTINWRGWLLLSHLSYIPLHVI